ncbi:MULTISPECIES: A24 family peptidase [unclassified Xanthobacter]|uniref:A24 family peptidase n=1 Tax=unclassified Xanthobacter TaxID=2623496 RepID=UPI001EE061D3|nr:MULTISPECIES: prepilin peptidase [unclassified Xanthobacter]
MDRVHTFALLLEVLRTGLYPALLCLAIGTDLARRIIPNLLVLALIAGFALVAVLTPLTDVSLRLMAAGAVTAAGFVLFSHDLIGAGDAKLAGALALWLDPAQVPAFVIICSLIGALLTLAVTLKTHGRLLPRARALVARTGETIPYGVALAGAGLLLHPYSSVMLAS